MSIRRSKARKGNKNIAGTPQSRKIVAIKHAKLGKTGTISAKEIKQSNLPYLSTDGKLVGDAPIEALHMVGDKTSRELRKEGIKTVRDLRQANDPKFITYTFKAKSNKSPKISVLYMNNGRIARKEIPLKTRKGMVTAKAQIDNGSVIEEKVNDKITLHFVYSGQKVGLGVKSGFLMEKIRAYLRGDITQETLLRKRVGKEKLKKLGL